MSARKWIAAVAVSLRSLVRRPNFFVSLSRHFAVSGSWTAQVAGYAAGVTGALDLQKFERHQAKPRLMYAF